MEEKIDKNYIEKVVNLLEESRRKLVSSVNHIMVLTYYEIGRILVEEEQEGSEKAEYAKSTIKNLSKRLLEEYGRGFSVRNLEQMRKFYLVYSKTQTASAFLSKQDLRLSWSHYLILLRIKNEDERKFYEIESVSGNWSVRELKRQFDTSLYERLLLSTDKNEVKKMSKEGQLLNAPKDVIKEPYVLEFLGLDEKVKYSENDLENAIINKLEYFLLELGKGFAFIARQKRISFDERHFYIDLVFYNRILNCFVLIDLKIGDLKHQDIGQMQMYVNYYDREMKLESENQTIGLILCKEKSELLVKYTLPESNNQIFASRYETVLPSKTDLQKLLNNND